MSRNGINPYHRTESSAPPVNENGRSSRRFDNLVPSVLDDLPDNVFEQLDVTCPSPGNRIQRTDQPRDFSLPHIFIDTPDQTTLGVIREPFHTLESSPDTATAQDEYPIVYAQNTSLERPLPYPCFLSNGSRDFVLSIIKSYPRMITQHNNLPPYIHPYGCSLHFACRISESLSGPDESFIRAQPLKPLEACISIARMLVSRSCSEDVDGFLWRTIDSEHRHINEKVRSVVPPCPHLMFYPIEICIAHHRPR